MRAGELIRRLISGELTNYEVVQTSPEPLQIPRKSKFQTEEEYTAEAKEWKAIKLLPIRADSGGHHMTQRYYTEHLLSVHMNMVQESRHHDTLGEIV
jgi:hypothetical protein